MPGSIGNKNAEKWTPDISQKFVNQVHEFIKENVNCTSLEEACCELGQYESLLEYLKIKFDNTIDFMPIKKAKAIIKGRLMKNGLTNKYNPTMCIFILKNNHDMKDKNELDISNITINWTE